MRTYIQSKNIFKIKTFIKKIFEYLPEQPYRTMVPKETLGTLADRDFLGQILPGSYLKVKSGQKNCLDHLLGEGPEQLLSIF